MNNIEVFNYEFKKNQVEDQGVQLNRILRLLKEEEMALYKRCNLNESRSRTFRPRLLHDPFKSAIESSNATLKRNKQFLKKMSPITKVANLLQHLKERVLKNSKKLE